MKVNNSSAVRKTQTVLPATNRLPFGASLALAALSSLLLGLEKEQMHACSALKRVDREELLQLANSHHVILRALDVLRWIAAEGNDQECAQWAAHAADREQARIDRAVTFLHKICDSLTDAGCEVIVIKSLDHWPDLGSDLDLFTSAEPEAVIRTMRQRFDAHSAERSWGDRLANKWNFVIPALGELVEVHVRRLGQTGEQAAVADSLISRARYIRVAGHNFRVASAEDRLLICTLQRMYRHFYARLCDIVDTACLVETGTVDFERLRFLAKASGIWEGTATFLAIVSDYVSCYRRSGLALPSFVSAAARFGGDQLCFSKGFLRVPILPHSAKLYASQLTTLVSKGELRNSARLSLLPCLAAVAALQYKMTGSDKGIW